MAKSNKKLNIGFFVDSFGTMDGVVNVVKQYTTLLKDRANVVIACPKPPKGKLAQVDGVEIVTCNAARIPIVGYDYGVPESDIKFMDDMRSRHFDIIHIHSPFNVGKAAIKIAEEQDIPVVATFHSQYKRDFKQAFKFDFIVNAGLKTIMKVYNACDEVWPVNSEVEKILIDYGYTGVTQVMCNATEMQPLDSDYRDEVNKKYVLKSEDKLLLFVGRLITVKNIDFVLEVERELKAMGKDYKLMYVGDGYGKTKLKENTEEYGLEDNVIFAGKIMDRTELAKVYQRADLYVFPSFYDADTLSKYEAASQGTPTIFAEGAATIGGIKDRVDGYIASAETPRLFAEHIVEVLENEEEYKDVCERVKTQLYTTWEKSVNEAYEGYLRIIKEHSSKSNKNKLEKHLKALDKEAKKTIV